MENVEQDHKVPGENRLSRVQGQGLSSTAFHAPPQFLLLPFHAFRWKIVLTNPGPQLMRPALGAAPSRILILAVLPLTLARRGEVKMCPLLYTLVLAVPAAFAPPHVQTPQPTLTAAEAVQHVGENRTVCGAIVNEYTASTSHGTPTFVDSTRPTRTRSSTSSSGATTKMTSGASRRPARSAPAARSSSIRDAQKSCCPTGTAWYVPQGNQTASR